jgi:ribosomal protein L30E
MGARDFGGRTHLREAIEYITEMREYDVTYYQRIAIDHGEVKAKLFARSNAILKTSELVCGMM